MVTDIAKTTELSRNYYLLPQILVHEITKCPTFSLFYLEPSDTVVVNGFDSNLLYFGHFVTRRRPIHGSARETLSEIPFTVERITFPKALDELNNAFCNQLGNKSAEILWGKVSALEKFIPPSTFFAIWQDPINPSQIREKGRLHMALVTVIERGTPVSPLVSPQLGYAALHSIYPFEPEGHCRLPFLSCQLCDYQIVDLQLDRYMNDIANETVGRNAHGLVRGDYQYWSEIGTPCEKVTSINPCALSEKQIQPTNTFSAYVNQLQGFYNSLCDAGLI